jgi:hypothetical protein
VARTAKDDELVDRLRHALTFTEATLRVLQEALELLEREGKA